MSISFAFDCGLGTDGHSATAAAAMDTLAIAAHDELRRRAESLRGQAREQRLRCVQSWLEELHRQLIAMQYPGDVAPAGEPK